MLKISLSLLGVTFGVFYPDLFAAQTYTWTGTTSDQLDLSGNWSPTEPTSVPVEGDVEIFNDTPTNISPFLNSGATFAMFNASFNNATTNSYNFQISNSSTLQFGISGETSSSFISGVENYGTGSIAQSFTVNDGAAIDFLGVATANYLSGGGVTYTVGGSTAGTLNFQENSVGGFATILAGDTTGSSVVAFSGNADAATSTLEIGTSLSSVIKATLTFADASTAGSSTITIGNRSGSNNSTGALIFYNSSTAGNSTISLSDHLGASTIDFYSDSITAFSTAGNSIINVTASVGNTKTVDGTVTFHGFSSAANATITVADALGNGKIVFDDASSAANASITIGENSLKATGSFNGTSSADNAQISVNSGSTLTFYSGSTAASAQISVTNGSILNFEAGSLGASSSITLSESSSLNFGSSSSYTLYSLASDAGSSTSIADVDLTVNYNGDTTLAIEGDLTGSGGLFTMAGTGVLALNGTVTGDVIVTDGTVIGTGTIEGNLTVTGSGTISPGQTIGTRNVQGNYIQDGTAIYAAQIAIGSSSLLDVTGTATLSSSPVEAVLTSAGWSPGYSYLILSTESGITGAFATPSVVFSESHLLSPWITPTIVYDPNLLAYLILETNFTSGAKTSNQKHVADQLDSITNMTPPESLLLSALAVQTSSQLESSLDALSGEPYANQYLLAEVANRHFIQNVFEALAPIANSKTECCSRGTTVWVLGGYGTSSFDDSGDAAGLNMKSYDVSLGLHSSLTSLWTVGGALMLEQDHIHYKIKSYGSNRSFLGSFYALYRPKAGYVLADFVGGFSRNRVQRPIDIGDLHLTARGAPTTNQVSLYGEGGVDWQIHRVLLQPFMGLEAEFCTRKDFRELGAGVAGLECCRKNNGAAYSRLGLHMTGEFKTSCVLVGLDAAWDYRLLSTQSDSKMSFKAFGQNFSVEGVTLSRSSFDASAFLNAKIKDCWRFFTKLSGQKGSNASSCHVIGGFETSW